MGKVAHRHESKENAVHAGDVDPVWTRPLSKKGDIGKRFW